MYELQSLSTETAPSFVSAICCCCCGGADISIPRITSLISDCVSEAILTLHGIIHIQLYNWLQGFLTYSSCHNQLR